MLTVLRFRWYLGTFTVNIHLKGSPSTSSLVRKHQAVSDLGSSLLLLLLPLGRFDLLPGILGGGTAVYLLFANGLDPWTLCRPLSLNLKTKSQNGP